MIRFLIVSMLLLVPVGASAQSQVVVPANQTSVSTAQETANGKVKFRRAMRKAIAKARKDGTINFRQAATLQTASFSPAFIDRAEELAVIQMALSGAPIGDDVVPVNSDGQIDRPRIDWDKLGDFLVKILPVLLEFLLALGIGA